MKSNLLPLAAAMFVLVATACGTPSDVADSGPDEPVPPVTQDDVPSQDDTVLGPDGPDSTDLSSPEPDGNDDEDAAADRTVGEYELDEIAAALEGLELVDAQAWAAEHSMNVRVVNQDGEALMVTMDFSLSRINVAAVDNVVSEVLNFG